MTTFGSTDGPPEEDWKTLDELRGTMKDIAKAKLAMGEKATVKGLAAEIEVLKQQLEMTHEQMRRLIGIYGTLQGEFRQFQAQRVVELQSWLAKGGGSTTPEDHGTDIKSSD